MIIDQLNGINTNLNMPFNNQIDNDLSNIYNELMGKSMIPINNSRTNSLNYNNHINGVKNTNQNKIYLDNTIGRTIRNNNSPELRNLQNRQNLNSVYRDLMGNDMNFDTNFNFSQTNNNFINRTVNNNNARYKVNETTDQYELSDIFNDMMKDQIKI